MDANFIHTWQRGNVGYLNSPFSPRCRENSFDAETAAGVSLAEANFESEQPIRIQVRRGLLDQLAN